MSNLRSRRALQRPAEASQQPAEAELIVPGEHPPASGAMSSRHGTVEDCFTNIPSSPAGRALRINARGAADLRIENGEPVRVDVVAYLVHPHECTNSDTGETYTVPRTVLIQRDGTTFATTGAAVRDRLAELLGEYGPGPWLPPIPVEIVSRSKKSGMGSYHDLRVVVEGEVW